LLDEGPFDLNIIATWDVSQDDRRQFAQLIGYSLDGFSELNYADDETYAAAKMMAEGKSELDARVEFLQGLIESVREKIKDGIAELFERHPGDFDEVTW
jgi:hypothetical protein